MVGIGAADRAAIVEQDRVDGAQTGDLRRHGFNQLNGAGFKRMGDINAPSVGAGPETVVKIASIGEVEQRVIDVNPIMASGQAMQARRRRLANADADQTKTQWRMSGHRAPAICRHRPRPAHENPLKP